SRGNSGQPRRVSTRSWIPAQESAQGRQLVRHEPQPSGAAAVRCRPPVHPQSMDLRGRRLLVDDGAAGRHPIVVNYVVSVMEWSNDQQLFELMLKTLYTSVVGDVLDTAGYWYQFLPQVVRPMRDDMRLVGRAMPVVVEDAWGPQDPPFGKL